MHEAQFTLDAHAGVNEILQVQFIHGEKCLKLLTNIYFLPDNLDDFFVSYNILPSMPRAKVSKQEEALLYHHIQLIIKIIEWYRYISCKQDKMNEMHKIFHNL